MTSSSYVNSQTTISAEGAQKVIASAIAKAIELSAPATVAVVDVQGILKALVRMDGSPLIGVEVAVMKARTAVLMGGADTGQMAERLSQNATLLARLAPLPGIALLAGGSPLKVDGAMIGAVGVSAPSGASDEAIVVAAVEALTAG